MCSSTREQETFSQTPTFLCTQELLHPLHWEGSSRLSRLVHASLCPQITAQCEGSIGSQHPTAAPRSAEHSDRHPGMGRQRTVYLVMSWGTPNHLFLWGSPFPLRKSSTASKADLSVLTVWGKRLHFCVPSWLCKASRTSA